MDVKIIILIKNGQKMKGKWQSNERERVSSNCTLDADKLNIARNEVLRGSWLELK